MSKVSIRGVIVSSAYDVDWLDDEINKGLLTPLSRVESAVAEASETEPMELYINSPGGSVFAGHEMLNSIVDWRSRTGQPVNITIGAMCASAASTIAIQLGPVKAHANTLFMFHSAQSEQVGGPGSMLDMAELLEKINRQAVTALVAKYNMNPDTVAEWFAEGRMGWIDADEAQQAGLVSEVIQSDGEIVDFSNVDMSQYGERGLAIAALVEIQPKNEDDIMDKFVQQIAEVMQIEGEEVTIEQVTEKLETMQKDASDKANAAYEQGKADAEEDAITAKVKEQTDEITAKLADVESSLEAKEQEVAQLTEFTSDKVIFVAFKYK